jgi:hypothetical protein
VLAIAALLVTAAAGTCCSWQGDDTLGAHPAALHAGSPDASPFIAATCAHLLPAQQLSSNSSISHICVVALSVFYEHDQVHVDLDSADSAAAV